MIFYLFRSFEPAGDVRHEKSKRREVLGLLGEPILAALAETRRIRGN